MNKILLVQASNYITVISDEMHRRVENKELITKVVELVKEHNRLIDSYEWYPAGIMQKIERLYDEVHDLLETNIIELSDHIGVVAHDIDTYVLRQYNDVKLPKSLAETIVERENQGESVESLVNFWLRTLLNPNPDARKGIWDYVNNYGVLVTQEGLMMMYKSVEEQTQASEFDLAVGKKFFELKSQGKNPAEYYMKAVGTEDEWACRKISSLDLTPNDVLAPASVLDHYKNISQEVVSKSSAYTDWYSGTFDIDLGVLQEMDREEVDSDPDRECSRGLHLGSWSYVENFAGRDSHILVCVASPTDVVAIPRFDRSKIRFCRYYPYMTMGRKSDNDRDKMKPIDKVNWKDDFLSSELSRINDLVEMGSVEYNHLSEEEFGVITDALKQVSRATVVNL